MSNYSQINKILHRQFLNKGEILKLSIDKIKKRSLNFELSNPKHVFVCGLARAGTTALLEALDSTKVFGSLRYKYMPFILIPKMAKLYSRYFVSDNKHKIERLHADGLKINSNSAECLDEPFWINFKYKNLSLKNKLIPHNVEIKLLKSYAYFLNQYQQIENKEKLIIKNNNNHLRILSLSSCLPNCNFLVVFRSPIAHALSLLKLHKRFLELQEKDPFILEYMNMIGHWEFGKGKKPFIYQEKQINMLLLDNSQKISYWIKQWIFTYEWLLKEIINLKNKNVKLICYEELCNNISYKEKLFLSLGLEVNNETFKFKVGHSNSINYDLSEIDEKQISYAFDIYEELKCHI